MEKMTTMERLFVEVFDRKSRIELQLYQQFESYGQSLACNIIADDGCPPPWLWEMGTSASVFSSNAGITKEQLISGIFFPFLASNASSADQNTYLNMPDLQHGKCNPNKLICEISSLDKSLDLDLGDNANILMCELNQGKNSECIVVESHSKADVLELFPNIRSHQICSESLECKNDKIINGHRKGRAGDHKERKTMSRIECENAGLVENFSSANKDLELVHGGVGRVTRSRSRLSAQKHNSCGNSFAEKWSNHVNVYANLPTECHADNINDVDMVQICGSNAANEISVKAQFDKSSIIPGIPSLVEPIMANLNGIASCQGSLKENAPSSSVAVPQPQEAKIIYNLRKVRTRDHKERKTASRIEFENAGLVENFSSANEDLELVHGDVGRVTRSRSRLSAQKHKSSGNSFGKKLSNHVKDFANLPTECHADKINDVDMVQIYGSNAANEILVKVQFDKSSIIPGNSSLVEPVTANLNEIECCQGSLSENAPNSSMAVLQTQEVNIIHDLRKHRTRDHKERKCMSRIELENAGFGGNFSSANRDLDLVNGGVGRVTRSRSRLSAQTHDSSGNSFGEKLSNLVKDYTNLPTECHTENINGVDVVQIYGSNAAIEMFAKPQFDKSSIIPSIPSLAEPVMTNSFGSYQVCLNENALNTSVALPQTQEGSTCKKATGSHVSQTEQVQKSSTSDAELVSGIVEINRVSNGGIEKGSLELIVVENCECTPHFDSNCKVSEIPIISSASSPAGDGLTSSCKNSSRNQVVNLTMTREASPGITDKHAGEKQLSVKLKTEPSGGAFQKVVSTPIVGGADLLFDFSVEDHCRKSSIIALNSRKRSVCCEMVSCEIDNCKLGKKGSVHDYLMDIPYDLGGKLAVAANSIGKEDSVPMGLLGGDEICDVADPGLLLLPASNGYEKSNTPAVCSPCLQSDSSRHACSAQVAGCIKNSMSVSAQGTSSGTNSLQIKNSSVNKTSKNAENKSTQGCYFLRSLNLSESDASIISCSVGGSMHQESDKVETGQGTVEKVMPAKVWASVCGKSYSEPSEGRYFLRSSVALGTKLPSYRLEGACHGNELERSKETIDQFHCSWPNRIKLKNKASLTTPPSSSMSFLDITQKNECDCKASSTTEANLLQFSSKSTDCLMQSAVPSEAKQDGSDSSSKLHELVIRPSEFTQNKSSNMAEEIPNYKTRNDVKPCNLTLESKVNHTSGGSTNLFANADFFEKENSKGFVVHNASNEAKEPCYAPQSLFSSDITRLSYAADEDDKYDESMPLFEGLNIDIPYLVQDNAACNIADIPSLANERFFVLEQLRQSGGMNLDYSLEHNNADLELPSASSSNNFMGICCKFGSQLDGSVLETSHSISSTGVKFCSETRNPSLTPPLLKFSLGKLSGKRSSSSTHMNPKSELMCFRIDENSSTTEENADFAQIDFSAYQASSRNYGSSNNSTTLSDVTAIYQNMTGLISNRNELEMRNSLESVTSDAVSSILYLGNGKSKIENAENPRHSAKENRFWKTAGPLSNMSVKSKASCKSSQKIRDSQSTGKSSNPFNILSSITSFVPLVQQKHGGSLLHGKKEIKVKALEAAEVAKRLEVKKQIERETRKAAIKLQRERVEQKNAKQLKLKQQQKEEEKKEADIATRKRQRREEDKNAKHWKRRCKEQSRTLHKGSKDKVPCQREKDFRQKAVDVRQKVDAKMTNVRGLHELEKAHQIAEKMQHTINDASVVPKCADDNSKALGASNDDKHLSKGVKCSDVSQDAVENLIPGVRTSMDVQSYEMSPYQSSDDEEIEEYSWRKQKFVPLWARQENLGQIILSTQHLEPKEVFNRKRSFSLSEVLSSRVITRPWR